MPVSSGSGNVTVNTDPNKLEIEDGDTVIVKEPAFTNISFSFTNAPSAGNARNMMKNITAGVMGMPYQYPDIVDMPIGNQVIGRKYAQKIASVMPVLFLMPGEPAYMTGYSKQKKRSMLELYDSETSSGISVDDIVSKSSNAPFYVFNGTFGKYAKYVNLMVRSLANFMGLGGERYYEGGGRLAYFSIYNILPSQFRGFFNAANNVAFYLDSDASISESFSNGTSESMLSQKVNSFSDTARELQFLFSSASAGNVYDAMQSAVGSVSSAMEGVADTVGLGKGIMSRISSALTTVVAGGKMVFPEIWSDSGYSKSYNISMKFRSPDPDPLSILLNVYIPCCCLAGFVMPKQMGTDANGYISPHLVRATYKSIFNCEMGIVDSLSFTRGGEDKWNAAGMPTAIDATLSIKDLYSTMFMSDSVKGLLNNVSELDWLALMAGIDMNKDWVMRNISLKAMLTAGSIMDAPNSMWNNFKIGMNNLVSGFLHKTIGSDNRWN